MVAALVRRSVAAHLVASTSGSSWSSSSRHFSSSLRFYSTESGEAPARSHRPRSMVGPDAPGQSSSSVFSKEESMGTGPTPEQDRLSNDVAANVSASRTPSADSGGLQRQMAGKSALSLLDSLAVSTRDGTPFKPSTQNQASSYSDQFAPQSVSPVSTPSSPDLMPVYETSAGPIYTSTSLPVKTDPTLEFMVNLLMKDGKKGQAERLIRTALEYVAQLTHSNPLPLVQLAVERCSPLVRISSRKVGAKKVQIPLALTSRQSKRKGIVWILEAANKRSDRDFSRRLAAELIAVSEGSSPALAKKEEQHKMATANRANASIRV